MLPDDQVHPDTHVLTVVNNVIGVVNYVIAARPSLLNFVIADKVVDADPAETGPQPQALERADEIARLDRLPSSSREHQVVSYPCLVQDQ